MDIGREELKLARSSVGDVRLGTFGGIKGTKIGWGDVEARFASYLKRNGG